MEVVARDVSDGEDGDEEEDDEEEVGGRKRPGL